MSIKGFYEYGDEELKTQVPAGTYHVQVVEASGEPWDDGGPRVNIVTRIVCGPFAGKYGPRYTMNLQGGTTTTGVVLKDEDVWQRFIAVTRAIHPGRITMRGGLPSTTTAEDVAEALTKDHSEFFVRAITNDDGFLKVPRYTDISPMAKPPMVGKGAAQRPFRCGCKQL